MERLKTDDPRQSVAEIVRADPRQEKLVSCSGYDLLESIGISQLEADIMPLITDGLLKETNLERRIAKPLNDSLQQKSSEIGLNKTFSLNLLMINDSRPSDAAPRYFINSQRFEFLQSGYWMSGDVAKRFVRFKGNFCRVAETSGQLIDDLHLDSILLATCSDTSVMGYSCFNRLVDADGEWLEGNRQICSAKENELCGLKLSESKNLQRALGGYFELYLGPIREDPIQCHRRLAVF